MQPRERLVRYLNMISGGKPEAVVASVENSRRRATAEVGGEATAAAAIKEVLSQEHPAQEHMFRTEAIIREDIRPAFDVFDDTYLATGDEWGAKLEQPDNKARLEQCLPAIGRVELKGHSTLPYAGTAFVVGQGLVMTNRHVAEVFAGGLGVRELSFRSGLQAGFNRQRELNRTGTTLWVRQVVMIHPYWDMALLAVDGLHDGVGLVLSSEDAREFTGRDIVIVGYPAFDPRNPPDAQRTVFGDNFGIKRLQPGQLQGGTKTGSFGKIVAAAAHDCSTLGGNSGSALIDLSTGAVLGLHFGGAYHDRNFAVPSSELLSDSRVVDAGVRHGAGLPAPSQDWDAWWKHADPAPDAPEAKVPPDLRTAAARQPVAAAGTPESTIVFSAGNGAVQVRVAGPLLIRVESAGDAGAAQDDARRGTIEKLVEPFHEENYDERTGYDAYFLDAEERSIAVPLPAAKDPGVLAPTSSGDNLLRYQNFSIAMHAKRRLALFAASNIARERRLREPDGTRHNRGDLTGLGKNDLERWFLDPRLSADHQLPDAFFSNDRAAFDKGHLVRREDAAWGETYRLLRRANGDTYHVTNCTPQVMEFNRSAMGEENWGDLENVVFSSAATERLCVFAGPVLKARNRVFYGVGDDGAALAVRIPQSYWKVIVARSGEEGERLLAFGFVLEQDLSKVKWEEFVVTEEFVPVMRRLSYIENAAGISFAEELRAADQYGKLGGNELAFRGVRIGDPAADGTELVDG